MIKHLKIRITGIVQGVGFRPFIYTMALKYNLYGTVKNDTEGVIIHAEGTEENINKFIKDIRDNAPPLSSVRNVLLAEDKIHGYTGFKVEKSEISNERFTFLPPDTTICNECRDEFFNKDDRRHTYPFITCTNCGPRFSIVDDIPYDRKNTSMAPFKMCTDCQEEYDDPLNRRFHTQPNACEDCGPHLSLYNNKGGLIADSTESVTSGVNKLLIEGSIIAIKSSGGYHIACDALNDDAVMELRKRKGRPFKPFALMAGTIKKIDDFLYLSNAEKKLLLSRERPIVILKEKKQHVSRHIAPGISFHGIMLPYMPFHHLLFSKNNEMTLVMTSGNISDEPVIFQDEDAFKYLGKIADYIVTYNRDIIAHSDDSILFVEDERPYFIRRSRGYVPVPFYSSKTGSHILAVGGDLKNSFALAKEDVVILSQYLGDMASPSNSELYLKTIEHFKKVYDFSPEIIVSDMHPAYFTNLYADELEEKGLRRFKVQHHHAHIASVMEDRGLEDKVIGLSFDGTGYGTDGNLWGSEFLIVDRKDYVRAAHFSNFNLPGGESAIKDVWKIGVSMLFRCYGSELPIFNKHDNVQNVLEIIEKGINSPLTNSIGRIFDGISGILGLAERISAEAEAAQLLEEEALRAISSEDRAPFIIPFTKDDTIVLQTEALTDYIVSLIKKGEKRENIAYAFHSSLAVSTVKVSEILREQYGIDDIVLSGGVFQNRLLLNLIVTGLKEKGFDIYTPLNVPFNDGCIAHGQLAIAKAWLKNG